MKRCAVEPKPIVIVEGILIFADPRLLEQLDIKVFVDTPDDIRFIRRLRRDIAERGRTVESVIEQYVANGAADAHAICRTIEASCRRNHSRRWS